MILCEPQKKNARPQRIARFPSLCFWADDSSSWTAGLRSRSAGHRASSRRRRGAKVARRRAEIASVGRGRVTFGRGRRSHAVRGHRRAASMRRRRGREAGRRHRTRRRGETGRRHRGRLDISDRRIRTDVKPRASVSDANSNRRRAGIEREGESSRVRLTRRKGENHESKERRRDDRGETTRGQFLHICSPCVQESQDLFFNV